MPMTVEDITYQVEGSRGAALCCILGELLELGICLLGSFLCFSIRVCDAVLSVVVMPISLVYGIVAQQYLLFCLRALQLSENHSMEIHLIKARGAWVRCLSSVITQQRRMEIQA
jgi:hypothetical protein